MLHRTPVDRRLEAVGAHTADIGEHRGVADDARTLLDREQSVLELDAIGREDALQGIATEAPAEFHRVRGLRLEHIADRHEACGAGAERSGGVGADEGARVARRETEELTALPRRPSETQLRQEVLLRLDGAGLVRPGDRGRRVLHLHAFEARHELQRLAERELVLQMVLHRLGLERVLPLRQQRVAAERGEGLRGTSQARLGVEPTGLVEVVVLDPDAGFQRVTAERPTDRGESSFAIDVVLGCPHRQRRAARGRHIGRTPEALSLVLVHIHARREGQPVVRRQVDAQIRERVLADAGGIPIRVIAGDGVAEARRRTNLRGSYGSRPIGRPVVPVLTPAADDVEGQILIVALSTVRIVVIRRDRTRVTDRLHGLQAVHALLLLTRAFPRVGGAVDRRQRDARTVAAERTGVEVPKDAARRIAATGQVDASTEVRGRVEREKLERAAQVAGRGRAERTRTLRQ